MLSKSTVYTRFRHGAEAAPYLAAKQPGSGRVITTRGCGLQTIGSFFLAYRYTVYTGSIYTYILRILFN